MQHSTWTLTTMKDGNPVALEGLSHAEAVAAIRRVLSGEDPLTQSVAPRHRPAERTELSAAA